MPDEQVETAVDPDVDPRRLRRRHEWGSHRWLLPTIGAGGMVGASARHALELAWPTPPGAFPWATFVTNASGCALIGLLMVYVVEVGAGHPLLRPFVAVGVLGGFTTFSTYTVETTALLDVGEPGLALVYLFGTLVAALLSVVAGVLAGRSALALLRRQRGRELDRAAC